MDRRKFLKRTTAGVAAVAITPALGATAEEKTKDAVGFNHLPNPKSVVSKNSQMKAIVHKANSRGHANHGWLDSHHSFSFASYYNPERMHFGVLRVLNDDRVIGGAGFGKHPHDNMEIISIPLEGDLEHKDSMGNTFTIKKGDVQVMSAGSGIFHSEKNKHTNEDVKFLQIWVYPNKKNVSPRYDQLTFNPEDRKNVWQQVVSPNPDDAGVWIHQDAWFFLSDLDKGEKLGYDLKKEGNGVYLFLLSGQLKVGEQVLEHRDGIAITDTSGFEITATEDAEVLVMDIPMN